MRYQVNILDSAVDDIDQLISYLQSRWGLEVAEKAYIELMDKLALLETQPQLGSPVPELVHRGYSDYRILVHNRHTKILYRLDEQRHLIYIHIVFSSKQDFQTLLHRRLTREP